MIETGTAQRAEIPPATASGTPAAVRSLASLLAPRTDRELAALASRSAAATRRQFGKTMRLFAPVYLSNECVNRCRYCGFSRERAILRLTLSPAEVLEEARALARHGLRSLLLVAGEDPRAVSTEYLEECIGLLRPLIPSISLEVAPMEVAQYRRLVRAGAEGLVVYQETYHRPTYAALHPAGPKRDFDWRMACPERAHAAGFRRIGIGALLGLHDWREEALALAAHADLLLRRCWKAHLTISFPRIRPAAGGFAPSHPVSSRDLIQLVCAFRLAFPTVGLVLSTRESPALRDVLIPLGITIMSAGSHTDPGGYTGQGKDHLHLTRRGYPSPSYPPPRMEQASAEAQFSVADHRSPAEIAETLRRLDLDPVWKDWDHALLQPE